MSSLGSAISGVRRFGWDSLLRNSVWILATAATNLVTGFTFVFIMARNWSPHEVGVSASVLSAMTLASLIADVGVGATLVQMLPRQKSDAAWSSLLNTFLAVGACAGLVTGVLCVLVTRLAVPATASLIDSPLGVATVVSGVTLFAVGGLVLSTYIAERRAEIMLLQSIVYSALRLVLLVALAHLTNRGIGIAGSTILASIVTVPLGLLVLVPRVRPGHRRLRRGSVQAAKDVRSTFGGHYLINLAGAAPVLLMPLIVASRLSASDAAFYYAAWAVGGALFSIAGAVASSLFAEGSHDAAALPRLVRRSAIVTICMLVPAMVVSAALGDTVLQFFGSNYAHRGLGMFLLVVVSALPQAATTIYVSVLRVAGRLRRAVYLYLGTGSVAMVGAWILLPHLGVSAAGLAWLGGQLLGASLAGIAWVRSRAGARRSSHAISG
ncbi:MAG TPA: oligosaccharide flippase family protein [Gaiellales bacterium]|jgi:O-antigen/teichoic acid export membrane protein